MKDKIMNTKETCEYLRTTKVTLFKMIRQGKIKANKVGNRYRFLKSELDKYLKGE